jgi:hypothetical protein
MFSRKASICSSLEFEWFEFFLHEFCVEIFISFHDNGVAYYIMKMEN